jgi:predicted nucleotidyltransferase component of viral defense system
MLDADEVFELSKLRKIKPWQEEKRYILSLLLYSLSEENVLLKGGTYLWLFHGLDRYSEDLDFLQEKELSDDLTESITKTLGLFGAESKVTIIKNDEYTFSFRTEVRGPLYRALKNPCYTYIEISKRERPLLSPLTLKLDEPRYAIPVVELRGMSLEEVAAEKIRAIMTRNASRDLYDLWFLVKKLGVKVNRNYVEKKLAFYGLEFSFRVFEQKLEEHGKAWNKELKPLIFGPLPTYDEVIHQVIRSLQAALNR